MASGGEGLREGYEIAVSALYALTRFKDEDARLFAEESLGRVLGIDQGTPFADLRYQNEALQEQLMEVRSVLRRIIDIVGRKSFMDAVSMMNRFEDVFAHGERAMLELALKEAERCLGKER